MVMIAIISNRIFSKCERIWHDEDSYRSSLIIIPFIRNEIYLHLQLRHIAFR